MHNRTIDKMTNNDSSNNDSSYDDSCDDDDDVMHWSCYSEFVATSVEFLF